MTVMFFSKSLDDCYADTCQRMREHIEKLPESHFQSSEQDRFCDDMMKDFGIKDVPIFGEGGDGIKRDRPIVTPGSDTVKVQVYFPFSGGVPLQFVLYHGAKPDSVPQFRRVNSTFTKTYVLSKSEIQDLDALIERDVAIVRQYSDETRRMIPRFNDQLREVAKQEFDRRVKQIGGNRAI